MNNLPENDNNLMEEGFSTIFSDPTEHKAVKKAPNKKRLKIALSLVLAFAVLLGGTFAVVKLIPEKVEENPQTTEDILVLDCEDEPIKNVVIKNNNGTFKFFCRKEVTESDQEGDAASETIVWGIDGYDEDLTDSGAISDIVNKLTYISAIREITSKSEEECGFAKPRAEITLNLEERVITILIGDKSPDNVGNYLKVSTSDKIYLVEEEIGESLLFNDLDLADTEMQGPIQLGEKYADYYSGETLASFDKLTVSSVDYEDDLVFVQNPDESLAAYVPHLLCEPMERLADNVTNLFSVFHTGFYVSGVYSYDASKESIKKFGLDSPDFVLSATFGDYTYSYKFKKQEDGYYAFIGNDSKNIRKVSTEDCGFLTCSPTFFFNEMVFITPIDSVKNLTLVTTDDTYSFDITKNPSGDENDKYIIECNGKNYNSSYFQSFYQYLCSLQNMEFDTSKTNQKPELSIVYNYTSKNKKPTKIDFVKLNATKYQYSIDGVPLGKIGSTSYKKIIKLLDNLLAGKPVTIN